MTGARLYNYLSPRSRGESLIVEKGEFIIDGQPVRAFKPLDGYLQAVLVLGNGRVRLLPREDEPGIELAGELPVLVKVLKDWQKVRLELVEFAARGVPIPNARCSCFILLPGKRNYTEIEADDTYGLKVVAAGLGDGDFPKYVATVQSHHYDAVRVVAVSKQLQVLMLRSGVLLGSFSMAALRTHYDWPWSGCLGGGLEPVGQSTLACLSPADVQALLEAHKGG